MIPTPANPGRRRLALLLPAAVVLAACAAKGPPLPKPTIRSIAVVLAEEPAEYGLQNVSGLQFLVPLAATANHVDSQQKAKILNQRLSGQRPAAAQAFNTAVLDALRASGYDVQVLKDAPRAPGDPDSLDFAKLRTTADAVLQLRFTAVGLYSPRASNDYLPQVNGHGTLVTPDGKRYVYDAQVYYGADAKAGTDWSVPADRRYAYPTFEAVLADLDGVRSAFETGGREVGARMARQVHAVIQAP